MLGQKSDQVGLEHIVQDAEKSGGRTICASPSQAHGGGKQMKELHSECITCSMYIQGSSAILQARLAVGANV